MLTKNMVNSTNMILDPQKHRDGVELFLRHFGITTKPPKLQFLRELLAQFARLPYENISKIIKLERHWDNETARIRLPEEIIEDHFRHNLGGTCFSLTFYLQSILLQNGYTCYPVMADMMSGTNIHCCLVVILDSIKYLVDPGYLLTTPMEMNPEKPRLFRNEFSGVELRHNPGSDTYDLFTFNQQECKWRYRFGDRQVPANEFLDHWQASFTKSSMHSVCLTKVFEDGLIFVHKKFMCETTFTGKQNYNIKRDYHARINQVFGIDKQMLEQAQAAIAHNMKRERDLGIYIPKEKRAREVR